MLAFWQQLLLAAALDLLLGDPRWFPHPVRFIARAARFLESVFRRRLKNERAAGAATVAGVLTIVALTVGGALALAYYAHPLAGDALSVFLIYTSLAPRDLATHAWRVYAALRRDDLPAARRATALFVGRDTENLSEEEIVRAAAESVAENLVDGVTAPLLFAALGGAPGALLYKAVNTMDSLFGYKDERYLHFGWAAARLDDLANYLPARLSAPFIAPAALLLGLRPLLSLRILLRDGRKHPSPNAGLSEAAAAGALGVRLGGLNYYRGKPHHKPFLGDPLVALERRRIAEVTGLALMVFFLFTAALCGLSAALVFLI